MYSEEVLDSVNNAAKKSADLIPEPRACVRNALPQTFQQVAADFRHLAQVSAECVNNAAYDLRNCLDYLHDDGREIFNQRNKQLNARRNKLRNRSDYCVNHT